MQESTRHPDSASLCEVETYDLLDPVQTVADEPITSLKRRLRLSLIVHLINLAALAMHAWTIYAALSGWSGLTSKTPIFRDDHPLYFYSAKLTTHFLNQSGSTAGYDPKFMAGYAKSAVFPASSTLPELVMMTTAKVCDPAVAYKFYVLASALLAPLLVCHAASGLTGSKTTGALSSILYMLYIWTDFPVQYIGFGMLPYFLSLPLALATLNVCCRWLENHKPLAWLGMTALLSLTTMVHFTSLMILGPAAIAAWSAGHRKFRTALAGLLALFISALLNAFWWWPGVVLASTKGESGFAFSHPEGLLARLAKIGWSEAPVESLLIMGLLAGGPMMLRTQKIAGRGLLGFACAGFFWGYGAGAFRGLDFLQPGRHTYAFYLAGSLLTAHFVRIGMEWLIRTNRTATFGFSLGALLLMTRIFGPVVHAVGSSWTTPPKLALTSSPPVIYTSIRQALSQNVAKGERILYEEGGFGADPFSGGRYSAILADELGIEMIGGPYLHASLTTNVAQFGEGRLFGKENWDLAWLQQVSRRYGLTWIVAWSDRARGVIDANPSQFRVVYQDGPFRIAAILLSDKVDRSIPLSGDNSVDGPVEAGPGRLSLKIKEAGSGIEVDRIVVLRYHWVPGMQAIGHQDVAIEPEISPDKSFPPLIQLRLKPSVKGPIEIRLNPWSGLDAGS